jgi:hypothetical protein
LSGLRIIQYSSRDIKQALLQWTLEKGRALGDVVEYHGEQLVLVARIPEGPGSDIIDYIAFVRGEDIQL